MDALLPCSEFYAFHGYSWDQKEHDWVVGALSVRHVSTRNGTAHLCVSMR